MNKLLQITFLFLSTFAYAQNAIDTTEAKRIIYTPKDSIGSIVETFGGNVIDVYDKKGRLVERFGKYGRNTDFKDDNNFRTFYYYDSHDSLIRERKYVPLDIDDCAVDLQSNKKYTERVWNYSVQGTRLTVKVSVPFFRGGKYYGHYVSYDQNFLTGEIKKNHAELKNGEMVVIPY